MYDLSKLFKPITVSLLRNSVTYTEIEPCDVLKPYIRCFWGSPLPYSNSINEGRGNDSIVIPDCCMDIIFNMDCLNNKIDNLFCSINDEPFYTTEVNNPNIVSTFGIRFNFWSAYLFADKDFQISCNESSNVDRYFKELKAELENIVLAYPKIEDRVFRTERLLIKKLYNRIDRNNNFLNAVHYILKSKGTNTVTDVSQYTSVSSRQVERIFRDYIGISPKKCCSLVRYQNMWRDMVYNNCFNFSEIIYKYRYSDQAHMIKDFKKYHGSTPQQAVHFLKNRNEKMSHFYNTEVI
jgi:AraC-like DNA-binding protein